MYKIIYKILYWIMLILSISSCRKFLDTKSDQSLATPETLNDLQMMLDNTALNRGMLSTNASTDEYYLTYNDWLSRNEFQKDNYIWSKQFNNYTDWRTAYIAIFYANTVLFNLEKITFKGNDQKSNNIKGSALFYRAYHFFQIAQLYAPQYNASSASTGLGIPLRLTADFNAPSIRSTVQETYDRIVQDLNDALPLLPNTPLIQSRPSKAACYAMLARTYLQMANYTLAKENASACLQIRNQLLDFNRPPVNPTSSSPIPIFNEEVIFYTSTQGSINGDIRAKIDTTLYSSFDSNDLRRSVFFLTNSDGSHRFKGSYNGGFSNLFNGIATDEIYLIRAECYAREGNIMSALNDLNTLLSKRWKTVFFVPIAASTVEQALAIILKERKKELIYRGVRWSDLRRLNNEPAYSITLRRNLNGQVYELPPNDLRYAQLIPYEVTSVTNLPQNPR